jgi:hypothetical protein
MADVAADGLVAKNPLRVMWNTQADRGVMLFGFHLAEKRAFRLDGRLRGQESESRLFVPVELDPLVQGRIGNVMRGEKRLRAATEHKMDNSNPAN